MNYHSRVKEEFGRQAETLSVAQAFTDSWVLEQIYGATKPTKIKQLEKWVNIWKQLHYGYPACESKVNHS